MADQCVLKVQQKQQTKNTYFTQLIISVKILMLQLFGTNINTSRLFYNNLS